VNPDLLARLISLYVWQTELHPGDLLCQGRAGRRRRLRDSVIPARTAMPGQAVRSQP
jgi:hypothetical protein